MDNNDDDGQSYFLNLFRKANNPDINELLNLLGQAGKMPTFSVSNDVRGYGDYNWDTNQLRLSPQGGSINTVAHELTHAADNTMTRQYFTDKKQQDLGSSRDQVLGTWLNHILGGQSADPRLDQWTDGYEKLRASQTKLPTQGLGDYRGSPAEMRAFGVGNMNDKGNPNQALGYTNVDPHLDPTMATEAALLRDLYLRRLKLK